jgi:hypothetical protein
MMNPGQNRVKLLFSRNIVPAVDGMAQFIR